MADLEKLLLEAAGRTGKNRHSPPARKQHDHTYSDDSDDGHAYASRKPYGSQVPLKKRTDKDDDDDDDDRSSQEEGDDDDDGAGYDHDGDSGDDDSVGSDLYKDEADRQKLAEMTELEREFILSERATKKDDKVMREKMRSQRNDKTAQPKKDSSPRRTPSRGLRSSARSADRVAAKDDALNELRAKRLKHRDPDAHGKPREGKKGFSPALAAATSTSSSGQSESGSDGEDEEESAGDGGMMVDSDDDDDKISQDSDTPKFEDIKEITIQRSKLGKWLMEPFFDELIVGCFVRVGIGKSKTGPIYRLCMVRNIDASDPNRQYKLENITTSKYLNVIWGNEGSAARWQMAMVSDSPPVKAEFDQWVREVERSGGRMPRKREVAEKRDAIQKTNAFVYSAATVKQMLQDKKSAARRPLNVAAEKDRLRREMVAAKSRNDEAEAESIKERLEELEASRQVQGTDAKAVRLAEMNKRNRVDNFKNAFGLKPASVGLKAGEAGYDPFSRRWTRSRNYYVSKSSGGGAEAAEAATVAVTGGVAATAAALEAAADAGKLVDTSAPVDQGTESNLLHNFDLPISLVALQKFGGPQGVQAGFMARKQRIEATIGCQVPVNDGRRHALTLSVSDYKRRRGLL